MEMIDIHNHILYGLDDGAKTLEESVEMCRISFNDGVRTIVATPHTLNSVYENNRSTILAKVQELNAVIDKEFLYIHSELISAAFCEENGNTNGLNQIFMLHYL